MVRKISYVSYLSYESFFFRGKFKKRWERFLMFPTFPTICIFSWETERNGEKEFPLFPTFPTSFIFSWEIEETERNYFLHFLRVKYYREKLRKWWERFSYVSYISYKLNVIVRNWRNGEKDFFCFLPFLRV